MGTKKQQKLKFKRKFSICQILKNKSKMSYNRYGGGSSRGQGGIPSPWANQSNQPGNDLSMNLLGSMMSSGSGNMQNLATTLVAQALQNKPGGMLIGGNHFPSGGTGSAFNNSGNRGGFMDRSRGRDDYGRGRDSRDSRRPTFRRSRSRSRDRGRVVDRGSRDHRNDSSSRTNRPPPEKRMRAGSPKDRAPFEVYIGNYPVRFREHDLRNLFTENGVTVTTIRLKHDGHKVFAFAETTSEEEIQKAIKALDSKEIHGRRLRVRSSKDKDGKGTGTAERKRPPTKRELTEDDVTRHLVFAFNGFLDRQANKESIDEDKKKQIEDAKTMLKEAFDIPDDESLKISRNLELIFLHNNRREIPVPVEETKDENDADEKNEDETMAEDEKAEEEETDAKEENGEETKDGDDAENLVEDETNTEEANEETEANEDATEEAENEETEEQEDVEEEAEVENESEAKPSTPSTRGGRGRGAGTARRSRGRRGGAP